MGSINAEPTTLTLDEAVKTAVRTPLPADFVAQAIRAAPFVTVPGAFNFRDLSQPEPADGGGDGGAAGEDPPKLRRGFLYRSGMLSMIEDEGKTKLTSDLGVRTIFDLRLAREREKMASPAIDNVETCWLPPAQEPQPTPPANFAGEDGGVAGLLNMYRDILVTHVPIYTKVFEHIRDHPDKSILFHCTGGKDRTGILSAMILQLAGYPTEVIARDYTLTRVGSEPARDFLFKDVFSEQVTSNPDVLRGVEGMCSVHYETMVQFLEALQETHGGAEGYLGNVLGFSEADKAQIKHHLFAPAILRIGNRVKLNSPCFSAGMAPVLEHLFVSRFCPEQRADLLMVGAIGSNFL